MSCLLGRGWLSPTSSPFSAGAIKMGTRCMDVHEKDVLESLQGFRREPLWWPWEACAGACALSVQA